MALAHHGSQKRTYWVKKTLIIIKEKRLNKQVYLLVYLSVNSYVKPYEYVTGIAAVVSAAAPPSQSHGDITR